MKYLNLLILFFLISCNNGNNDKKEIIDVFNNTNKGLLEKKGELVYDNVSKETLSFYSDILIKSKNKTVEGNITQKMNIISVLMLFNDEELKEITDKDLVIKLYDNAENDEVKVNAINSMILNNLNITGNIAEGYLPGNVKANFIKEDGKWKYNYIDFINSTLSYLESIKEENNMTDSEIIEVLFFNNPNLMNKSVRTKEDLMELVN